MNKPKFTPGPLETDFFNVEDRGVYMVKDSLNQAVCECFTQYPFAGKPGITDDEAEGNAFLFAAAPDMYAALESACTVMSVGCVCTKMCQGCPLGKALRKARGESEVSE